MALIQFAQCPGFHVVTLHPVLKNIRDLDDEREPDNDMECNIYLYMGCLIDSAMMENTHILANETVWSAGLHLAR